MSKFLRLIERDVGKRELTNVWCSGRVRKNIPGNQFSGEVPVPMNASSVGQNSEFVI